MSESVSRWIAQLKAGDHDAAQKLWQGYFHRLVGLARVRLQGAPRRAADEEDVALSAFHTFCRRAELGLFPQLNDRDDLWRLLVTLTERKAVDLARREGRRKRGGGTVAAGDEVVTDVAAPDPTPEFAAQVAEECGRLLGLLNEDLRAVALWKMEGETTEEIAARLGKAPRTVERKLRIIRGLWGEGEPA